MGVSDGARAATDVPEGGEGWSRDVRDAKRSRQFSNPRRVLTNFAKTALIVVPLGAAVVSEPVPTSIRRPRLRASSRATRVSRAPRACRAAPPRVAAALLARAFRSPRGLAASAGFLGAGLGPFREPPHLRHPRPGRGRGPPGTAARRGDEQPGQRHPRGGDRRELRAEPGRCVRAREARRCPARGGGGPVETRSGARPPRETLVPPPPHFFSRDGDATGVVPPTDPPPRRLPPRPSGSDAPPPPPSLAPRHRTARFR